jgi:hypothetical protein
MYFLEIQEAIGDNKKSLPDKRKGLFLSLYEIVALQSVNLKRQARFQVRSFVLVNDILFSQFVNHRYHFRIEFGSFFFIRFQTELFDRITGGFCIIPVVQPFGFRLSDPFER